MNQNAAQNANQIIRQNGQPAGVAEIGAAPHRARRSVCGRAGEASAINLIELTARVMDHIAWIVAAALLFACVGGLYAHVFVHPYYEATAKLYVLGREGAGHMLTDLQAGSHLALDYQEVFRTWEVHERVCDALMLDYSYDEMQRMVSISNPQGTRVLYITVTNTDAQLAMDIANAYAQAAHQFILEIMDTVEPTIFSAALQPDTAMESSRINYMVWGFLLGAALAACVSMMLYVFDDRPRSPKDIAQAAGMPTLAVIPTLDYRASEALNTLCVNLSCCGGDKKTILITSRYAAEGKTFVAMNLMRTLAGLQKKVVLLDADLRRSGINDHIGLRDDQADPRGLAQYLSGMCTLEEILYETDIPHAAIIPAGRGAANALQLLNMPQMPILMDALKQEFDVVLVDTPPACMLADALHLAKSCDGALLVVSYLRGKRSELPEVVEMIERTGCPVLGAVLNRVAFDSFSSRRYYYRAERYAALHAHGGRGNRP